MDDGVDLASMALARSRSLIKTVSLVILWAACSAARAARASESWSWSSAYAVADGGSGEVPGVRSIAATS
jgi:hypothetical protein